MSAQPHLRVVDAQTGELLDTCPDCQAKAERIRDLKRDLKAWMTRARNAERDKEQEAREHESWDTLEALFAEYKAVTDHPRLKFTPARFWEALPIYTTYGEEMCLRAFAGAKLDPYRKRRKNGSVKRCDEWWRIFSEQFEEFCNKAPIGWKP